MVIFIAFGLISIWYISVWQHALLKKPTADKLVQKIENIADEKTVSLHEKIRQVANSQNKTLVFVQADLPAPPEPAKALSKNDISHSNGINHSAKAISAIKVASQPSPVVKKSSTAKSVVHPVNKKSVSAIYQQLSSDSDINIELAWPNNISARQDILIFLYQCIGMKFGVLSNGNVTLAKTPYQQLDQKQQPSEWLRIAQGQLANQEQQWLKQYNLAGTPVRLFPKSVDWQLAKHINNKLKGEPLKSLRARYKRAKQRLLLTDIQLNGQQLSKNWTLITTKCSI